jgi:hypothetical protein
MQAIESQEFDNLYVCLAEYDEACPTSRFARTWELVAESFIHTFESVSVWWRCHSSDSLLQEFEEKHAMDGSLPDPTSTDNAEFKCFWNSGRTPSPSTRPSSRMGTACLVSARRPSQMSIGEGDDCHGRTTFFAIEVNGQVAEAKFDKVYGCRHSLPAGITRATGVMFGSKRAPPFVVTATSARTVPWPCAVLGPAS